MLTFFRENVLGAFLLAVAAGLVAAYLYAGLPHGSSPAPTTPAPYVQPAAPLVAPAPNPKTIELEFWRSVSRTNDVAQYEDYLNRYPDGEFAGAARERIAALKAAEGSPGKPPEQTPPSSVPQNAGGGGPGTSNSGTEQQASPTPPKKCVTFNDHVICN